MTKWIWLLCLPSHILVLYLLAIRRARLSDRQQRDACVSSGLLSISIRLTGILTAAFTLGLPYLTDVDDPLSQAGLRCVCFFYACKILDLAIIRADTPPILLEAGTEDATHRGPVRMETWQDHAAYVWNLLTEMRYLSFDIAVVQKGRERPSSRFRSIAESGSAGALSGVLAYLLHSAELNCLCLLMILQAFFEILHTLLHPWCLQPIFYRPLGASSTSSFWTTHWHACAAPWLQSLCYKPGRRYIGRWFGVLATFNLTGLWHAWCSMAVVEDEHALSLGIQVWVFFMIQGVMCLAERLVWGQKQGGLLQKELVWSVALGSAGQAFRTLERYSKVDMLRKDVR